MIPQVDLRKPEEVMKLSRLGSLHQSRISFMRVLLRRLASENWHFDKPNWNGHLYFASIYWRYAINTWPYYAAEETAFN